MKLTLNVIHSLWSAPDFGVVLAGGKHELPNDDVKLSAGLVRAIAAAAGAGAIEILEVDAKAARLLDGVVEPDEDSLKVYEQAVKSGVWLDGHLQQVIAEREQILAGLDSELKAELEDDVRAELEERRAFSERLLTEAARRLAAHRGEA